MNHDVFISYSSQNMEAAQAICHVLEQNEIRCWMAPRDIPYGSQYGDVIDDAIKLCKVIVVLFSETAATSQWVNGELNVAFEEQKPIIPFRLDQTPLQGQTRVMLNQRHWIDAYPDYKTKFIDLVTAVAQFIGKEIELKKKDNIMPTKEEVQIGGNLKDKSKKNFLQLMKFVWIPFSIIVLFVFLFIIIPSKPVDEKWEKFGDFNEGLASVKNDSGRVGFIDNMGILVIPCKWKNASSFSEELAAVESEKGLWGFINKKGDVVIPCEWKSAWSFSDGLALVRDFSEKSGFINKKGGLVIPCKWKEAGSFSEGIAYVLNDDKLYGFIDTIGSEVIPCKWNRIHYFREGLLAVQNESEKWGFIDKKGYELIPCTWKETGAFSEGLACVQDARNDKWGYINKKGEVVIQCKWEYAFDFEHGKACVWDEDRESRYINKKGEIIK